MTLALNQSRRRSRLKPDSMLADVPPEKIPRHIAIIMDGNGRWARRQGLPRIEGHRRGADVVRRVTEECARLGIEQLTLYCLSSENWKRPAAEIAFLMQLLEHYMIGERTLIMEQNIRVSVIGRREGIPDGALAEMDRTVSHERRQHRHDALPGDQLRQPRRAGGRLPPHCRRCSRGTLAADDISEETMFRSGFTRPACPSRTCSSARRARCV